MATRKQATVAPEALELDKTLVVDGNTYNINAVHSDKADNAKEAEHAATAITADSATTASTADFATAAATATSAISADKVNNRLTINKTGHESTEYVNFDGSEEKSINIVPTEGGAFTGRITVPTASDEELSDDEQRKTVLNYGDIINRVVDKLINTSTMATWNNLTGELDYVHKVPSVNGLCVVKGVETELISFSTANNNFKWLPDYLYICTDSGNIYLGTSDSPEFIRLAAAASKFDSACRIQTDLSSASYAEFGSSFDDADNTISPGVTGVLKEINGGTGQTSLSKVSVGSATNATNLKSTSGKVYTADAISAAITDLTAGINTNEDNITKIANGTTPVAKATSATTATSATSATKDGSGNTIASYYQPKILTGTVDPSQSTVPAVKNAPNGAIYIKYTT